MNTELDSLVHRVDRLEIQNRRLRFVTFGLWPTVLAIITVFVLLPGKIDLTAMKYLLGWIGGIFGALVIVFFITLVCWFLLKVAVDFKNRNSRIFLNPGSGRPPAERNTLEQAVTPNEP